MIEIHATAAKFRDTDLKRDARAERRLLEEQDHRALLERIRKRRVVALQRFREIKRRANLFARKIREREHASSSE